MEQNKDQDGAAVRGEAVAEMNLAAAILSIPVEVPFEHQGISQRKAYMAGAEEVRAKAASKVSARAADAPSEPTFVWIVGSKTFSQVFVSEEAARAFVSHLPPSVSGGISITKSVVIGEYRTADALDSQPTDSNRLTKAEREADIACETCHGTGQMCVGTSGQESDGNGPVMEPCAECGYGEEPSERESLIACLGDDAVTLLRANPDDEMAQTMREAAAMLHNDGERLASSQPTEPAIAPKGLFSAMGLPDVGLPKLLRAERDDALADAADIADGWDTGAPDGAQIADAIRSRISSQPTDGGVRNG